MSDRDDRPLSYWISLAQRTFANDLQRLMHKRGLSAREVDVRSGAALGYVSRMLSGAGPRPNLSMMVALARAVGGIVQIRIIDDGSEATRIVDYETAATLDDKEESARADFVREILPQVAK